MGTSIPIKKDPKADHKNQNDDFPFSADDRGFFRFYRSFFLHFRKPFLKEVCLRRFRASKTKAVVAHFRREKTTVKSGSAQAASIRETIEPGPSL